MSDLGSFEYENFEELKNSNYTDLDDLVFSFQLTIDEIIDILELENITRSTKGYTLSPGAYEVTDNILMLKSLLPKEVKVSITNDDVKLKSNLTNNKTIRFTGKMFFYTIVGFIQSYSGELGDLPGLVQLISGAYKSDKPFNITGFDKVLSKSDCIDGSIVNGISQIDSYYILLLTYMHSSFRAFDSYLRSFSSLDENDNQLNLNQKISKLSTYKTSPGLYT